MSKLTHHHLTVEEVNDQHGPAIMLEQQEDGYDEPNTVLVHPWQLRAVCERFGIIASDQQAAKTIATLQRRMVGLRDRIAELHDWVLQFSDHQHADLSHEMTRLDALRDLACEWCADFDGEQGATAAESNSTATECTSAPASQASLL